MSTEDWKKRYLRESGDWEAAEKILRRGVARLAIAGMGNTKALDKALGKVQKTLKSGNDRELERAIDEVSRIVQRLEDEQHAEHAPVEAPAGAQGMGAREYCEALVDALKLSAEDAQRIAAFRRRLQRLNPEQCVEQLALELSDLLREAEGAAASAAPKKSDDEVQDVLLALVNEVAVLQPSLGALQTIRETLQSDRSDDWHAVLSRIVGEIRSIVQQITAEKKALEALVRSVSSELGELVGVIQADLGSLHSGRSDAERLHTLMDEGVSAIQERIESESDIERLKEGVSRSLGGIRVAITEFAESDAARLAEAEARNQELLQRVERMEKESDQLQTRLDRNRELLLHDTLTGVRSRLAYDESLAQELSRFQRYGEVFSLAVIDIDFFKSINDTYGHSAGDKGLQLVARQIAQRVRETDLLFRVGGEEFVLMLPHTGLAQAKVLVEEVRAAIGASAFHFDGKPVTITLSAGVTEVKPEDTVDSLFSRADDAMYRAKKGGRNQLVSLS
ncbi:MAG: GGDEF domain-containing protein [Halieaceae bacterium]|jgi:diguanylate cyclase|nr:GGDEF domain-containing protein [Halieaceae bacterium]